MDQDIKTKIEEMDRKINAIYESVEKTRKYILWTGIITLAVVVLPLIGLMFVIPSFIGNYTSTINALGN